MKSFFKSKTFIALAVAVAATAANATNANEQPIPPPAYADAWPACIVPGTPLAEVYKMAQANVDLGVITAYITNSPGAFNLDADKIIALTDAGVPSEVINLMITHDKNTALMAAPESPAPPAALAAPQVESSSTRIIAPPPKTEVTVQYFQESLTPYGGWVEVEGYGRCWRPSVVVYDTSWRPYCDRGRWVYSDCGWYWDSDYAWGATFHYGRWFNHSRYGWCWWPDTVWGASWVSWRSGGEYCGWAPLPPLSVYRPGLGFYYRGSGVAIGFDFGLSVSSYTFISVGRLCDRRPRYYCEEPHRGAQIYNNTTVINNYHYNDHSHTVINNGVPVERVSSASRRPIQPVAVNELPNAARHGWRGEGSDRGGRRDVSDNAPGRNNSGRPTRPEAGPRDAQVGSPVRAEGNPARRSGVGSPQNENAPSRPAPVVQSDNRPGNRDRNVPNRPGNPAAQNVTPPANINVTGRPISVREQPRRVEPPVIGGAVPNNHQTGTETGGYERTPMRREERLSGSSQSQFNPVTPAAPSVSAPQNNWQQNRRPEPSIITSQPQRSAPAIEQRPIMTPSAPRSVVTPTAPSMPEHSSARSEARIEQHQNPAPSAPSYSPPAASESHSAARAERAAERSAERNADHDKKDR